MERHMSTQVSLCFSSAYQMAWPMFTQLPRGPYIIPTEVCFTDFLALLSQIGSDDYESQPDIQIPLKQWFWDFLMLWPFNTVLHVVVTPSQKIVSLLLHNYWSATVISYNVNILHAGYLICYPKGVATHRLSSTTLNSSIPGPQRAHAHLITSLSLSKRSHSYNIVQNALRPRMLWI
jgi:hypothetical protein